jgi:hypothetical protein
MASEREGCPFAAWPSFQSPPAYWKAGVQLFLWCRFLNRTPGPPPFSSMNSTGLAKAVIYGIFRLAVILRNELSAALHL